MKFEIVFWKRETFTSILLLFKKKYFKKIKKHNKF